MYIKQVLDNGLRIISEQIPYVKSVSIGVWVGAGARNEMIIQNGISHFVEHMFFKGTQTRSAKQIAEEIDGIGGQLNAFTGKECTCYYAKTLDTHIDCAFDVLSDMLFNSKFADSDIEIERKVILEEIGMYEDSPEEMVHDLLAETIWKDNALGYPILGTSNSLKEINRYELINYIKQGYCPENTVISVAGSFDTDNLTRLVNKYFGSWSKAVRVSEEIKYAKFNSAVTIKNKDTEQVHMCIGFNGMEHNDDKLYALLVVNNIIGGGMSSRLFQKVREEKGLVYSIYSYPSSYKKAGTFTIYAGMNPKHVQSVIELLSSEIKEIVINKFTKEEIDKAKQQLKGGYILGLESTSNRMTNIGKSELLLGKVYSSDEILDKIESVSIQDIEEVIEKVFCSQVPAVSVIGKIQKKLDFTHLFAI